VSAKFCMHERMKALTCLDCKAYSALAAVIAGELVDGVEHVNGQVDVQLLFAVEYNSSSLPSQQSAGVACARTAALLTCNGDVTASVYYSL
jgi:hypothetical protein